VALVRAPHRPPPQGPRPGGGGGLPEEPRAL